MGTGNSIMFSLILLITVIPFNIALPGWVVCPPHDQGLIGERLVDVPTGSTSGCAMNRKVASK